MKDPVLRPRFADEAVPPPTASSPEERLREDADLPWIQALRHSGGWSDLLHSLREARDRSLMDQERGVREKNTSLAIYASGGFQYLEGFLRRLTRFDPSEMEFQPGDSRFRRSSSREAPPEPAPVPVAEPPVRPPPVEHPMLKHAQPGLRARRSVPHPRVELPRFGPIEGAKKENP